ncbi:4Fe-4S binding protein [Eubacterium aggregans]|uniref:4Fe-4S binding protein n=1 Tax=Eubacterium aggregans TaxID=81409 RepID=UPI00115FE4E9
MSSPIPTLIFINSFLPIRRQPLPTGNHPTILCVLPKGLALCLWQCLHCGSCAEYCPMGAVERLRH